MVKKGVFFRTLVTFDQKGISEHPNHISVANACLKYYEMSSDFDMYTLNTRPPNRGYMAFFTIFTSSSVYSNYYQWQPFVAMQALSIHES
jgi:LmbE family N-acetylglucosaminyl deacetylase